MGNKFRGYVPIELDKPRNLRFSTNALVESEKMLGKSIAEFSQSIGITELRILIYCGLRHEDKTLTLDQAGDLIDEAESIAYLSDKLKDALEAALKTGKDTTEVKN